MKNISIRLFAGIFIVICPGLSSALDFGISDISRQYYDINWDAVNTASSSSITTGDMPDTFSGFQADGESGWFIIPDTITGDSDPNTGIENGDQGATPPVPEPATMLLLGVGLVGIVGLRKMLGKKG